MSEMNSTANDAEMIMLAEHQLSEAHLHLDLETIERLLHPDYVIIQPGGKLETKREVLDSYRTLDRNWDFAQVDQLNVLLRGDVAIVVGRWQASGQHGPEQFDYAARFLSIWVKEDGYWQNIAYQATEIIDD